MLKGKATPDDPKGRLMTDVVNSRTSAGDSTAHLISEDLLRDLLEGLRTGGLALGEDPTGADDIDYGWPSLIKRLNERAAHYASKRRVRPQASNTVEHYGVSAVMKNRYQPAHRRPTTTP